MIGICLLIQFVPKKRYSELSTPIDWLYKTNLVYKSYLIECQPRTPLKALTQQNKFKLYLFDVGLLGHMLEIEYQEQKSQKFIEKGFIAECFVMSEWNIAQSKNSQYSWSEGNSEIEFLLKTNLGEIYPTEVESGHRTQAKSLKTYKAKYNPRKTIKLIGSVGGESTNKDIIWPIYYANFLIETDDWQL